MSLPFLLSFPSPFPSLRVMRTLPDPLTCSTGRLPPSPNVPKALVRSDIWFPDGNIVLIAGSAAFKVHRGQLERHSEVFKDMFLIGRAGIGPSRPGPSIYNWELANEEGNKIVDGCPTVDLYDCPSDVYHLLVALYDGFYFHQPHARDFSAISSVFRLSTKYFIEHLRIQCLARLIHDWPTTLADWDRREAAATDANGRYTPREVYAHPVLVINLALELGIPEVLPSAFYDLSRYGPSRILSGTRALPPAFATSLDPRAWCLNAAVTASDEEGLDGPDSGAARQTRVAGTTAPRQPLQQQRGPMVRLSHDSLVRTLRGRELAQLYISTFLTRALEHRPSSACIYSARAAATAAAATTTTTTTAEGASPTTMSAGGMAASPGGTPAASFKAAAAHCTESFYFIHLNVLRSVGGIAFGRDADPLYTLVQAAEMLERKDFSDGVRMRGLRMCGVCRREWRGEVGRAREEVWGLIPVWFGLRDGGAASMAGDRGVWDATMAASDSAEAVRHELDEEDEDGDMIEDGEDTDVEELDVD